MDTAKHTCTFNKKDTRAQRLIASRLKGFVRTRSGTFTVKEQQNTRKHLSCGVEVLAERPGEDEGRLGKHLSVEGRRKGATKQYLPLQCVVPRYINSSSQCNPWECCKKALSGDIFSVSTQASSYSSKTV